MTAPSPPAPSASDRVFAGDGEMAARCRAFDWSSTALGAVEGWPQSLRTAAGMAIASPFATILCWGPELVQIHNDAYIPIAAATHPLALGRPAAEAWPETWRLSAPFVARAQEGETVYVRDAASMLHRRSPDALGDDTFFTLAFSPVRDEAGAVGGVLVTAVDVTRAQREVERLLAATDDGLLGTDMHGRTTFANPAAERMLGWTAAELVGQSQHALIHHTRPDGTPYPSSECPLYHARMAGVSTRVEGEVFWRKDGTSVPVEYAMTPVFDDGAIVGAVVTFRDVSERRQAEAERTRLLAAAEDAQRAAEQANRAKVEFLATMSHELRTPLNAIGGYVELLELEIRGPINTSQRADLARIRQNQRHLLSLINEVLNYAKLEAGSINYAVEDVVLADMIASVAPLVEPQLAAKDLAYGSNACDGRPPLVARADRAKVRQVLLNLLSNAVKFTPPGGRVEVACGLDEATASRERADDAGVTITVRDTGVGIAADQIERVFEPFVQVDAALTRQQEGTGLGLAISRDLARGMGGELRVRSEVGVGSMFTLVLPRASGGAVGPGTVGPGTNGRTKEPGLR